MSKQCICSIWLHRKIRNVSGSQRKPIFSSEWNGLVEEVTNRWSSSALTNDNLTVYAPTPRRLKFSLERFQFKGEHKTFDLPPEPVFYDVNWMPSGINYKRISHIQNNQLASTQDNGVK